MTTDSKTRRGVGIKWKIMAYLFAYGIVVMAVIWLFQIFLLDDLYRMIVLGRLERASDQIAEAVSDGDSAVGVTTELAQKYAICISVYSIGAEPDYMILDGDRQYAQYRGEIIADAHITYGCLLHSVRGDLLSKCYRRALDADDGVDISVFSLSGFAQDDGETPDAVIYTRAIMTDDGGYAVVFLNCEMSPMSSTTEALSLELFWITMIAAFLAMLLAAFIAWRVSAPIADVNREAKALASNKYNGDAVRGGYREINELSETLTYAAHELSKIEGLQKELIANISHDLRTPLALIEGYAEMMRDIPGETTQENLQVVIDETRRLSTLVSDLLELSRLETGKQTITPDKFDLAEAVRDTVKRVEKLYSPEGYVINCRVGKDDKIIVNADKTRILQVLYNLIGNAANYTGEDKTVTVTADTADGIVRVSVTDTGEGIAEEDLPLIWDRYYKVDKTHKRGIGGSGLGLSIVKEILLLHNARFGVSSVVGAGSTFWFELPTLDEE